jgi:CBS domain-containing protein
MAIAKDLLRGREIGKVFSVEPEASVADALIILAEHNIGALLVMNTSGDVAGILSERDIVRKVSAVSKSAEETKVRQIMTEKVLYVEASESVEDCMAIMNDKGIRHLPVYENGILLGLISIRDVLRTVISEQQVFIHHLEHYIRGG